MSEIPEYKESLPFGLNPVDSGFKKQAGIEASRIKLLPDNPDVIIRYPDNRDRLRLTNSDYIASHEVVNSLRSNGIAIPDYYYLQADFMGKPGIYTVVDRVNGNSLDETAFSAEEIPEATTKFRSFYLNLINYYSDLVDKGGLYFNDLTWVPGENHAGLTQFVYGHTKNNPEKKIYLVDLCPANGWFDLENSDRLWDRNITGLVEMIKDSQTRLDTKFPDAWHNLLKFLEKSEALSADADDIETIKKLSLIINSNEIYTK